MPTRAPLVCRAPQVFRILGILHGCKMQFCDGQDWRSDAGYGDCSVRNMVRFTSLDLVFGTVSAGMVANTHPGVTSELS
jgi:hypothetical protein